VPTKDERYYRNTSQPDADRKEIGNQLGWGGEMNRYRYIQYGCGWCAPSGWRNFDASPTLRFERLPLIGRLYTKNKLRFPENAEYGDIVKGLPVKAESCDAVYCSHILEHLSLEDFRIALRNTLALLRPGGLFRLVVPDLEYLAKVYLTNPSSDSALSFMRGTSLGYETRRRNLTSFLASWLGNSHHLWMWDYKSIEEELERAGFVDIRRAVIGDSSEPRYSEVEDKERWENCLGVECKRPG
jgi:SAM-dependent methyltransferase